MRVCLRTLSSLAPLIAEILRETYRKASGFTVESPRRERETIPNGFAGINISGDALRTCRLPRNAVKWPRMTRRSAFALGLVWAILPGFARLFGGEATPPIDRRALVHRHDPVLHQFDAANPLSVGNGEFAFT